MDLLCSHEASAPTAIFIIIKRGLVIFDIRVVSPRRSGGGPLSKQDARYHSYLRLRRAHGRRKAVRFHCGSYSHDVVAKAIFTAIDDPQPTLDLLELTT